MTIKVYDRDDQLVCSLDDNNALVGSYPIDDGLRLHVSVLRALLNMVNPFFHRIMQ